RTIQVVNSCPEDIWIGIQGKPLLANGGLFLPRGQSKNIQAPNNWEAGRIWPRTGCATNAQGHLVCETGDCGAAFNNFGVECQGIGGQPPATLAEFTLQADGKSDFYDLSNVDGHSVGIKIEAFGTQVNNPGLGRFNCGSPQCAMDMSKCPPELSRKTSSGRTVCLAISAAHCCSPYNNNPNEKGGKCRVEDWPTSRSPGAGSAFPARYDEVFKQQCPDAYSWQFDDHKSTFQCVGANYRVTFCG
ncbi:thaumatin-like protein, partial [Geranomyces variabilis]